MKFSHPLWLIVGVLACLGLLWLWRRHDTGQKLALSKFLSPHLHADLTLSVSAAKRRFKRVLTLAALALLFVALAGPLVGYRWEIITRRGNEIIFAVDTSRSMLTPDVKPDRLTRAKLAIDDFMRQLDGDAIGLVAFAGDSTLVCPMTLDYGAFHESLAAIDTSIVPRGGTNITAAIEEAQAAVQRHPAGDRILILVTDGEDLEGDALKAAKAASKESGLKIYTIGVGTAQGDLIPTGAAGSGGFVKDDAGNFVKSRLDEAGLKAIAEATGGVYEPLGPEGEGFETLYRTSLASFLKHDLASRRQRIDLPRYQWPLAGSLLLLLASLLVGNRRRRIRRAQPTAQKAALASPAVPTARAAKAGAGALAGLMLAASLAPVRTVRADDDPADAYKKGDFTTAAKEFAAEARRDPTKPILSYNAGTAAYRAGEFPQAAQAFQDSIKRAPSGDAKRLADQQDAYYNLGNTLYRSGQKTAQSSPSQTIETWTQAVKAYDTALQMRPNDADSKYNRDLVKRKIDELKKQPPQNPPPGQQGQPPKGQPPQGQPPQEQPPQGQPAQGQPPQGQPPQGQPPQGQPPQGQPPPNKPPASQPPAGQPPQSQPPQGQPPKSGQPKPDAGDTPPPSKPQGDDNSDQERAPGEMSREEARQLLDSQKGDERTALGRSYARRNAQRPPDEPFKDW